MIVDWQYDPIKETLLHVDLKRIDLTKRIRVKVPVHTTGEPKGVKLQGGLHELITREIEIECLPDDIPEHFTVDVTELMIGQSMRASDMPLTGSMKLVSPPEAVISHVVRMRAEEVAPVAEAAPWPLKPRRPRREPEVIKKGKKEEAGRRGQEQEEVAPHVPGGRPGESGRGVREYSAQSGFLVIDRLAESHGIRVSRKRFMALVGLGADRRAARWCWPSRRRL